MPLQVRAFNPSFDAGAVAATAALLRRDVARIAFVMGASEFKTLDGESGWQALRAVAESGRCDAAHECGVISLCCAVKGA